MRLAIDAYFGFFSIALVSSLCPIIQISDCVVLYVYFESTNLESIFLAIWAYFRIITEEQMLAENFKEDWKKYCSSTKMLIPFIL